MKLLIMGTAAYERVPAMFCNCGVCEQARKLGNKNIRTQAQVLIDDTLLVDFGMDNYYHYMRYDKDYTKIENLIITHSHNDHFLPSELFMTGNVCGHNDMEKLNVFGNEECLRKFETITHPEKCDFHTVKPYENFKAGKYNITPIPASHPTESPFCYVIDDGEKVLMYNNDSGVFADEVYENIKKIGFKFDTVLADCTCGLLEVEGVTHMSLMDNEVHRRKLTEIGAIDENTTWIITHYSHNALFENGVPTTAERMEEIARERGMISAFDGMEIEI